MLLGLPLGRPVDIQLHLCGFVSWYVARVRVEWILPAENIG